MSKKKFTSLIFLAGGQGSRMGNGLPKQFRPLNNKPLARYSFDTFVGLDDIDEIIVICEPCYRSFFEAASKPIHFALPGKRRQDSVYHGLIASDDQADLICVHDSARPFVEKELIRQLICETHHLKAAALAIPATNTIKQAGQDGCVQRTLLRSELWEIQTPQVICRSLFLRAYAHAHEKNIEATDDISLIEALGEKSYLIKGSPRNFKITTPFDWAIAEKLCVSN